MSLTATVVITTKDRKDDLAAAVESALNQTARPQVLVMDDGSSDGTEQMIRERFPAVILAHSAQSIGYIAQRNRAAGLATGDIIFSLDDDAIFSSPDIVAQTLAGFDHPRVGAVAVPLLEPNRSPVVHQRASQRNRIEVSYTFQGTAHALRRDLFLRLGGYRDCLFHQGEEIDLAIRMLNAGYVVRQGSGDAIHHFESPKRDVRRMDLYGRRNEVLFAWHNVPMPYFPAHLLGTMFTGMRLGFRLGRPWPMVVGLVMGFGAAAGQITVRRPVSRRTYQLQRLLKRGGPKPLEEIEAKLPPIAGQA